MKYLSSSLLVLLVLTQMISLSFSLSITMKDIKQEMKQILQKNGQTQQQEEITQMDMYKLYNQLHLPVSSTFKGPLLCLRFFSHPTSFDFETLAQVKAICQTYKDSIPFCLSPEELFAFHGLTAHETVPLSKFDSLQRNIYDMVSSTKVNCFDQAEKEAHHQSYHYNNDNKHYTYKSYDQVKAEGPSQEVWLYSYLSVIIISLSSLVGLFLIPCLGHKWSVYILESMVSLGVGVLLGDSFMHLIPQAFGVHSHEEEEAGGVIEEENKYKGMYVGLTLIASIYIPYLFEKNVVEYNGWAHSHNITENIEASESDPLLKGDESKDLKQVNSHSHSHSQSGPHSHSHSASQTPKHSIGLFILIANLAHNIVDGIAIGASFAVSVETGLSTSIAIFFHEVPHEASDFVILLKSGYSKKTAVLFNCVNQITAFIGVIPGVYLGNDSEVVDYVIAATAGLFIYLSLVDLMPMLEFRYGKDNLVSMFWRNFGILMGVAFMIAITIVEEELIAEHDHDHDHDHNSTLLYGN